MIPEVSAAGVVPPFVGDPAARTQRSPYVTDPVEVVQRFATSTKRCQILHGWLAYRSSLHSVGFVDGFQWLDGSFCEQLAAREPNDIDLVTFFVAPAGANLASANPRCPMTQATKRAYLIAEKATLEGLVTALPSDSVLERIGLEDRLEEVTAELAAIPAMVGRTAESELVFYGAPVRGSEGIDAKFTSNVIASYQDLIAKTLAAKSDLRAMGPVPDARLSRLHVTNVVHGSFTRRGGSSHDRRAGRS